MGFTGRLAAIIVLALTGVARTPETSAAVSPKCQAFRHGRLDGTTSVKTIPVGPLAAAPALSSVGSGTRTKATLDDKAEDLFEAASRGELERVDRILRKFESHFRDRELANALRWAAFNGHFHVVERLRAAGADPYFVFHETGGDAGPDLDSIQWLKFNRDRCEELKECEDWNRGGKLDRAIELLSR